VHREISGNKVEFDSDFEVLKEILYRIEKKTGLSKSQIISQLEEFGVPISVFQNNLGVLEALVRYMKDELNMGFSKIAKKLNRDNRTIWASYNKSKDKLKNFIISESEYYVPIEIFSKRGRGTLEVLVKYLRDNFRLKYSEIAKLIGRDQRTIWTVYNKKRDGN